MPYDDPDPTDPLTLHGMVVETKDDGAMKEMAECFVEEYARLGFDADRILRILQTSGYAGPLLSWRALGREAISNIIDQQMSLRNRQGSQHTHDTQASDEIKLPVLDS
ncbi:MAG: hypothetical protein ACYSUQ_06965 [Planctomycetota bacterium]|jgi:hypothetical protein